MSSDGTVIDRRREGRRIVRGLQWTYVSIIIQGALKVAVLVILARVLEPRDFGLLGFALMCTSFVERVGQIGIGPAVIQQKTIDGDTLKTSHVVSIFFGALSTVVIWAAARPMAAFFAQPELVPILQFLSVGCLLEGYAATPDAILQRDLRFKEIMIAENLAYFVSMALVATTLAWVGLGVWSLVIATIVLKAVRLLVLLSYSRNAYRGVYRHAYGLELARMGIGFSLGRILNFFSLQGDNFVVGRMLGVDALGLYSRAYQLMTLPAMYVGQVFERVMFPVMAQKQDAIEKLKTEYLLVAEVIALVALPMGVAMYLLSPEIVLVAFGSRWEAIIPVLSILSFGVFFRTAYKCSDTLVRSLGAVYHYAARQGMYTVLVVGGSLCGARVAGVTGVAAAVVLAVAINYVSMTRLSKRMIHLSWSELFEAHLSAIWVSVWVGVGVFLGREYLLHISDHPFVVLAGASLTGLVMGLISLVLCARGIIVSRAVPQVVEYIQELLLESPIGRLFSISRSVVPD